MSKVLYITANPKRIEDSYSLTLSGEFIEEYKKLNPNDVVTHIDLYKEEYPILDSKMLGYMYEQIEAKDEEMLKMEKAIEQVIEYDKYVIATPLWNLGIPAIAKIYFDNICFAGKTFQYTANGPVGLLENKKVIHIQTSGSIFKGTDSVEYGSKYVKTIFNFLGVNDFEQVLVEGLNIQEIDTNEIVENARKILKEKVGEF